MTLAFAWRRAREAVKPLAIALGLTGAVFVVSYLLLYRGRRGDLHFEPFAAGRRTDQYADFARSLPGFVPDDLILATVGTLLAAVEIIAPLLPGLLLLLVARRSRPAVASPIALWLMLALLASGLFYINVLWHSSNSQLYFAYYGYAAGAVASAVGLHRVLLLTAEARRRVLLAAAGLAAALVLAAIADRPSTQDNRSCACTPAGKRSSRRVSGRACSGSGTTRDRGGAGGQQPVQRCDPHAGARLRRPRVRRTPRDAWLRIRDVTPNARCVRCDAGGSDTRSGSLPLSEGIFQRGDPQRCVGDGRYGVATW